MGKGMKGGKYKMMGSGACRMDKMMDGDQGMQKGQAGTMPDRMKQPCPMKDRMTRMEQRLDMMQGMMEQMLQHQAVEK